MRNPKKIRNGKIQFWGLFLGLAFSCLLLIALPMLAPVPASAAVTSAVGTSTTALVGWWTFDEGTSTIAHDFSGRRNNGTLNNISAPATASSGWNSGKRGKALAFDGTDDYVSVPNSTSLQPLTGNWAVSFWIYRLGTGASDFPQVVGSRPWSTGTDKGWSVSYSTANGTIDAHYADGTVGFDVPNVQSASSVPLNTWQHWAVVFDRTNGQVRFYKNGVLDVTRTPTFPSGTINQSNNIYMGREIDGGNTRRLNAMLDDIKVYNQVLSAGDIAAIYSSGQVTSTGVSNNSLFGYWPMDEGTSTIAHDFSGNGSNGVFRNSPTWSTGKRGGAVSLNGNNAYVEVPYKSRFEYTGGNITLSAWIFPNTTETDGSHIFSKPWNGSGEYNYRISYDPARTVTVNLQGATGDSIVTTQTLPRNAWSLVTVTIDSSRNVNIYFNGVLVKSAVTSIVSWVPPSGAQGLPLCIGTLYPYGQGWGGVTGFTLDGKIDEARIYTRVLSATEIATLYQTTATQVNAPSPTLTKGTLTSGLVGHWTFDGMNINWTNNIAYDSSGQNNNGAMSNLSAGSSVIAGKMGQALNFVTANNTFINTGQASSLNLSGSTITMTAWIKPNISGSGSRQIMMKNGGARQYGMYIQPGLVLGCNIVTTGSPFDQTAGSFSAGVWSHVACVYDGSFVRYYINGSLVSSQALTGTIVPQSANLLIGAFQSSTSVFLGGIDDVRIYNRNLSSLEIKQLYLMGK